MPRPASETSEPDLADAERFAAAIHRQFPDKLLAYNCSPSFNWRRKLSPNEIAGFQQTLAAMGYRFQFVTLAGFHSLNYAMFTLARSYRERGMAAYAELQQPEFAAEAEGYTATRHQREVGTGYFDAVAMAISSGNSSTTAMRGSTEAVQFHAETVSREPEDRDADRHWLRRGAGARASVGVRSRQAIRRGALVTDDWRAASSISCPILSRWRLEE